MIGLLGFAGLNPLVTLADASDFLSCAMGEGSMDGAVITQDGDSGFSACTASISRFALMLLWP